MDILYILHRDAIFFISTSLYFLQADRCLISCWGLWRHIQRLKPIELFWHLIINFLRFSWEGSHGRLFIIGLQKMYAPWQVHMYKNLTVAVLLCSSFNYHLYTGDSQQFNLVEFSCLGLRVQYSTGHLCICTWVPRGTSDKISKPKYVLFPLHLFFLDSISISDLIIHLVTFHPWYIWIHLLSTFTSLFVQGPVNCTPTRALKFIISVFQRSPDRNVTPPRNIPLRFLK